MVVLNTIAYSRTSRDLQQTAGQHGTKPLEHIVAHACICVRNESSRALALLSEDCNRAEAGLSGAPKNAARV